MSIQIGEPPKSQQMSAGGFALFALGFRPFFIFAGLSAVILLALWLFYWPGKLAYSGYFQQAMLWHAHEMLFGYSLAVVAGFLLTAVRNWTGMAVPTDGKLAVLALVWLLGRVAVTVPSLPAPLAAALDMLFIPMLAWSLFPPLWKGANLVNRYFLAFFSSMFVANLLFHLEVLGIVPGMWQRGEFLMLDTILLTLLLVAGRVMPFFTEKAVPASSPIRRRWVEQSSFVLATLMAATHLVQPGGQVAAVIALALAAVQLVRWLGWHHPGVWRLPVLWVLFAGYLWMILGLVLRGLAAFDLVAYQIGLHALTVGAVGVLTQGMMSRVALGHTGRDINVSKIIAVAFVLLNIGAVLRVLMPMLVPEKYGVWVNISGGLWVLAFLLFVWVYLPILWRPRIDGRPG